MPEEGQAPHPPSAPEASPAPEAGQTLAPPLAVVGVGGSAGALGGYERFFLSLPPDSGLAFVVVPHLDPTHRGLMPQLLSRCTSMPVLEITDGTPVAANCVHVLPPGFTLSIMNGVLLLEALPTGEAAPAGHGDPHGQLIDHFFESLAADQGRRAVGVVLSGMGRDGTQGVQAIHARGGVVLVQEPASAEYPDMPASAAATGTARSVLPVEDLGPHLYTMLTRAPTLRPEDLLEEGGQPTLPFQKILRLIRTRTGHDFTHYKRSTLVRRIGRRMQGHQLDDIGAYMRLLHDQPAEVDALFHDFTINVTSFFRDPEAFEELKNQLRQTILTSERPPEQFRVWVAGCSTGEEAYSVSIILHELQEELRDTQFFRVQVFATDIDKQALEFARCGLYPHDIAYLVSPARLEHAFLRQEEGYQVRPEIRGSIIFAAHSTFGDPPFTHLDLLCCRNMLIYLGAALQRQILSIFHYALHPGGLLFLGASETAGMERERFTTLSTRWKIYRRGEGRTGPLPIPVMAEAPGRVTAPEPGGPSLPRPRTGDLGAQVQRLLLTQYTPPAVVVSPAGEILHVHGRTSRFLELPSGKPLTNLFEMVQDDLRYEISSALQQAGLEGAEVTRRDLHLPLSGLRLNLRERPDAQVQPGLFIIVFEEQAELPQAASPPTERVELLERELTRSRELLQATVEQMGVSVEELRTANEELQTTNEELQSSNEELTTSKEELQSLNEELVTINAEHQRVIHDLAQAGDDMKNLLDSAGIATVFLGNNLRIKRFTPRITRVINLIPADVGRPITDISVNLHQPLTQDIARVLDTLEPFEAQVQTQEGYWYLMRISPYRTSDNFIDGVVLTFTNIDLVKALEAQVRDSLEYAEAVLDSMSDPLLVLDAQTRVITANHAFTALMQVTAADLKGEPLYTVSGFAFDQGPLQKRLRDMMLSGDPLLNYVIDVPVPGAGPRKFKVEAEPIQRQDGQRELFIFKIEDVTELLGRAAEEGKDLTGDRQGE